MGVTYFIQYEVHTCEEGWYVYLRPADFRVRAIREKGPLTRFEAEELVERLEWGI